jgi:hypothetical protein
MNIIGLSNLFNLTAQQLGFNGYHYGFESDMNRNVTNNLNVANSVGSEFPYLLFEKVAGTTTITSSLATVLQCRLNFYDLLHYANDSQGVTLQTIEQENALREKMLAFMQSLVVLGASSALNSTKNGFQLDNNSFRFDIQEQATVNRCIQITATFNLTVWDECPAFAFDPALVLPPYSYPPDQENDFEKLQP